MGQATGRFWVKKKVISFWEPEEKVKRYKKQIIKMLSDVGLNPKELYFDYAKTEDIEAKYRADRHVRNLGAR